MQSFQGEHPKCISSELTASQFEISESSQQRANGVESQEREQARSAITAGALMAALQQPWEALEMGEQVNEVEERVNEFRGVWVVDQSMQSRPRTKRARRNLAKPRLGLANAYSSGCVDPDCQCDEEIETDPEMPDIADSSDDEDNRCKKDFSGDRPMRSILDWAPGTDEQARTRNHDEDAEGQGAKAKPPRTEEEKESTVQRGRWRRKLKVEKEDEAKNDGKPVALFEIGGQTSLNEIEQNNWQPLPRPMVVDSGAGATVMPKDWCMAHAIKDSPGSLAEDFYFTADGTKVYNEGQRELYICTPEGNLRKMKFQVAKVKKALGSVSEMVDSGNRVVFDTDEGGYDISYIENKKTRDKVWLRRENGVYVLDMMVAPPNFDGGTQQPGFIRPGAR